jgi:hypothetical protein
MATDKQRDANRRNALHSTGPRTIEGKARAARNAVKHGITVDDAALLHDPGSSEHIAACLTELSDHYQPASPLERFALEELAVCKFRLDHVLRAETGLLNEASIDIAAAHTFKDDPSCKIFDFDNYDPKDLRIVANRLLGIAWQKNNSDLDLMSRYASRLRSRYDRALKQFLSLRATPDPRPAPAPPPSASTGVSPVSVCPPVADTAAQNEPNSGSTPALSEPPPSASVCGPNPFPPPPSASTSAAPISVHLCPSLAGHAVQNEPNPLAAAGAAFRTSPLPPPPVNADFLAVTPLAEM